MKCKAHNQGDRCRKEDGHEGAHDGQFTIWLDGKYREEKAARKAPKRNRVRNRFIDRFDPSEVYPGRRSGYIQLLGNVLKELRA